MPDHADDPAVMCIPTGMKLSPKLTLDDITARAREVFALTALGHPELTYLNDPGSVGRCGLGTRNDLLDLLVPLPLPPPRTMTPHAGRGRQRDLLGMLGRDDDAQAAIGEQTADRIQRNAELVHLTGHIMNTESDMAPALARIEAEEGVKLEAARHFHRRNRGEMVVGVAGREIPFRPMPVRTAVASEDQTEGRLMLVGSRNSHTDFRAVLEGDTCGLFGSDFKGAETSNFRIGALLRWQRIVLDGARHLGLPLAVSMKWAISTWSLQGRHREVQEVHNWDELLDGVIGALVEERSRR